MKGMVFSTFIEMVEEKFSIDTVDQIIEEANLQSGGAYTTIGTYDHGEIIELVGRLSQHTGIPGGELIKAFGEYLFGVLVGGHPQFLKGVEDAFQFLLQVDRYIHVEVRKLYPDAQLPKFTYEQPNPSTLIMNYSSERPFADLAEGMIVGCIRHFGHDITVTREDQGEAPGLASRFTMTKKVNVDE
jgi:Heme NO binding.